MELTDEQVEAEQRRWRFDMPDEEGDWLWINQWSCGCCLIKSGIGHVQAHDKETWESLKAKEPFLYFYETSDGRFMTIAWGWKEEEPYFHEGQPEITAWQRIVFPDWNE